jgi:hypothetical protein
MKYNPNNKNTWWFVSDENMILTKNLFGKTEFPKDYGVQDCIEQTYHGYCVYKDQNLLNGILDCWKFDGKKYRVQRYPVEYPGMVGMSRDHIIYSIATFLESGMKKKEIAQYVTKLPFNLGDSLGKIMNPELWLWLRLMAGKKIGKLYYPLQLFLMNIYYLQNKIIDKFAKFNLYYEDHPSVYKVIQNQDKPEKLRKFAKMLYPTYALKFTATMTNYCDDNWFTRRIRRIGLKMTPTYNYVIKSLFKGKLTNEEKDYAKKCIPIYWDRWSAILIPMVNDRPSYRILEYKHSNATEEMFEENFLDKDYCVWLIDKL